MGIGRRKFVKYLSTALIGINVNPLESAFINKNYYINKKLGVIFEKPNDWGYIKVADFGKHKKEQILNCESWLTKEEVWSEIGDPICIVTKYFDQNEANKGIFSPTITLNITSKDKIKEEDGIETFEELMKLTEEGAAVLLKEFTVLEKIGPYEKDANKYCEYKCNYLFEHVEINEPLKVELDVLHVEHNNYYYDFNMHQSIAQNQIAQKEFEQFKKTIKLI